MNAVADAVEVPTNPASWADPDLRPPLPAALSPSRMEEFTTCPRRYFYGSVLRLPVPPSIPAVRGTVVHRVLERLFGLERHCRSLDRAVSEIPAAWDDVVADERRTGVEAIFEGPEGVDRERFFAEVRRCVENYFTIENPTYFDAESLELTLRVDLDGFSYIGVIDRVDRIVHPTDGAQLWITDYKTGRMPPEHLASEKFAAMRVYSVLLEASQGEAPARLRLLYLSEPGRDRVLSVPVTEATQRSTRARMAAVSSAIRRAHDRWEWPTRPNRLCRWCDFADICPEMGGALGDVPVVVSGRRVP